MNHLVMWDCPHGCLAGSLAVSLPDLDDAEWLLESLVEEHEMTAHWIEVGFRAGAPLPQAEEQR